MATQASITLATRVYVPMGVANGIARWIYRGDAVFHGTSELTQSVKGPSKEGVDRIRLKLAIPNVATEASACACPGSVKDSAFANLEVVVPDAWSDAQRLELHARIVDAAASAIFGQAVKFNEGAW